MRTQFDKYDVDGNGTIDMAELTSLLQDLDMLSKLKTDKTDFVAEMFMEYDSDGNGVLEYVDRHHHHRERPPTWRS